MGITRESVLLVLICVADMVSTEWLLVQGRAVEFNPILRFYVDLGLIWFVAAKCLFSLAPIVGLEALRRASPRFVVRLMRMGIVLYLVSYGMGVWHANAQASAEERGGQYAVMDRIQPQR
jgi:hypothetical protein